MADVAGRVAAGAAVLDKHGPADWRERVNVKSLETVSCWRCVLGQVFRGEARDEQAESGYAYGTDMLHLAALGIPYYLGTGFSHDHGFSAHQGQEFVALDREWRRELGRGG